MRTKQEYIESLRRQKPRIYMLGQRIDNMVDHPLFKPGIDASSATYKAAHDPRYRDLATVMSPLISERINAWTHIDQNAEDLIAKQKMTRMLTAQYVCIHRCLTVNTLGTVWGTTYEIDEKYNTQYHQRAIEFTKQVQKNDLLLAAAITDVKGDRSLLPHQQVDPDLYLRVVEKKKNGIIVRGAKANITGAAYANEIVVIPCRALTEKDKDYAVCFAIPPDTPGVTLIVRPPPVPRVIKKLDDPLSSKYGQVECLVIFEDVFVPWERVFMCGEWDCTGAAMDILGVIERQGALGCRAGRHDLLIGSAALIAEYNGVEQASHIRHKLTDMLMAAEIIYACGISSAIEGKKHPSGMYLGNILSSNVGKYHCSSKLREAFGYCQDISGGLVVTVPLEEDIHGPETRGYVEKYLKGKAEVPTEQRLRAFKLMEDLTASRLGGWILGESICGGGSPQAQRIQALQNFDMERCKKAARIAAGIEKGED